MAKREKDEEREDRIVMEAIVDAYGPEEQAMGWHYYLEGKITFPFNVRMRNVSMSLKRLSCCSPKPSLYKFGHELTL